MCIYYEYMLSYYQFKQNFDIIFYFLFQFIFSIIASTIPVPSGSFIPVFKIGAALGRVAGELMHVVFPNGIHHSEFTTPIIPGIDLSQT